VNQVFGFGPAGPVHHLLTNNHHTTLKRASCLSRDTLQENTECFTSSQAQSTVTIFHKMSLLSAPFVMAQKKKPNYCIFYERKSCSGEHCEQSL